MNSRHMSDKDPIKVEDGPKKLRYEDAEGGPTMAGGELRYFLRNPLLTIGIFKVRPHGKIVFEPLRHCRECIEAYYVLKGEIWVDISQNGDVETHRLKSGDFFLLPKGKEHFPYNKGKEEAICLFVGYRWP